MCHVVEIISMSHNGNVLLFEPKTYVHENRGNNLNEKEINITACKNTT